MEAREATKYVALKILMAERSDDECPELLVNELEALPRPNRTKKVAQIIFVSHWISSRSIDRMVIFLLFILFWVRRFLSACFVPLKIQIKS